jgi:hypothetical protein
MGDPEGPPPPVARPRATPRDLWTGGLLSVALAILVIAIPAHGNVRKATYGDGFIYRYVAQHLTTPRNEIVPILREHGLSVRYARIVFPALIWLFSLGHPAAMVWVQPILMVVAAGMAGLLTMYLLRGPPLFALVPYLALAFTFSVAGGYAEPFVVVFLLAGIVLIDGDRLPAATLCFILAMLTKEIAVTAVVGVAAWQLLKGRYKNVLVVFAILPLLAWGALVAARFGGSLPWNDPWWRDHAFGTPFVALWRTIDGGGGPAVVAGVHAILALSALGLWYRNEQGMIALFSGPQVFITVPYDWSFIADGLRSVTLLEFFWVLAIVGIIHEKKRSRTVEPAVSHV